MSIDVYTSDTSILPPRLHRPVAVVVGSAVVVFVGLAVRYAGDSRPRRLDNRSQALVNSVTPSIRGESALIGLADMWVVVAIAILLAGLCLWLGHRRLALIAILGPGLTGAITTLAKPLVGRTFDGEFAYPSGHTGGATALGLVAALLLVSLVRPSPGFGAWIIVGGALLTGGGMAVLLVSSSFHYPTDTVGGFCTALAAVLGSTLVLDRAATLAGQRRHRPSGP